MPPKGTLGVAKCQNLKIQRSPHTGTGFGFEIAQKLTKIHWKVQLSNAIIVRTEQKKAPPKKATSRSWRSKSHSGSYHTMGNFHLSPFPQKNLLENFSTNTK